MRLRKLRIRSLLWLALGALTLVLAGIVMCLEVLGTGHFLAALPRREIQATIMNSFLMPQ
jgi:hypothetical protein